MNIKNKNYLTKKIVSFYKKKKSLLETDKTNYKHIGEVQTIPMINIPYIKHKKM